MYWTSKHWPNFREGLSNIKADKKYPIESRWFENYTNEEIWKLLHIKVLWEEAKKWIRDRRKTMWDVNKYVK